MTRRVPSRRSALEERSRKGAPPVRSASNLDNCPFKRRKRHSENGAALSCDIAYAPARHILSRRHRLLGATDKSDRQGRRFFFVSGETSYARSRRQPDR